jgi:tol-pal system protein YbgF
VATSDQEKPKEEDPMVEVLRNFVGDVEQLPEVSTQSTPSVSPTQLAQYEKQIEELRTENTDLKQKVVKFEQENRGTNARIAEIEAKYATEKLRADKADELTKGAPQLPKVVEEQPAEPATSGSSYADVKKVFDQKKYNDAIKGFKAIINSDASDRDKNLSRYWLGESYFAKKKYKEALPLFQETLKYKASSKKADAQYMIAQSYDRLGSKAKAKAAYEKVVKNYPMSKNVKKAKARWAKL